MAFLIELNETPSVLTGRKHKETAGSWHAAQRDGERVFQLDTFGAEDRKKVGGTSQSLQLDARHAQELVDAIRAVFPGIR